VKKRKTNKKKQQNSYKCYINENVTTIQTEAHHLEKCGFIGSVGVFYPYVLFIITVAMLA
jgi:hypothetical protein